MKKKLVKIKKQEEGAKANPLHVRMDYKEALESKKDILLSKANLVRISNVMKNYHKLRTMELKKKVSLHLLVRHLSTTIIQMEKVFPEVKIPRFMKAEHPHQDSESVFHFERHGMNEKSTNDLDSQLREIQERLNSLK